MTVVTVPPALDVHGLPEPISGPAFTVGTQDQASPIPTVESQASWHPVTTVADRRPGHRVPCDVAATLAPLDDRGRLTSAAGLDVRLTDVSEFGVGIVHRHPMPHRLVQLAFQTAAGQLVRLLVRLKWCRFKRADFYQSGGKIVRVLKSGETATES
jgi:hypothetical protein